MLQRCWLDRRRVRHVVLLVVGLVWVTVLRASPAHADHEDDWEPLAGTGVAGFSGDGGPALGAELKYPRSFAYGSDGTLYICDMGNGRIRAVRNGIISTVAGNGRRAYSGDGGPATAASLYLPMGIAVGPDNAIYIADTDNNRIRKVTTDGTIHTVAGTGRAGYDGDGAAAIHASLNRPRAIAVRHDGTLVIADSGNQRIRTVTPDGRIHTIAGTGARGYSGDGGPATSATLDQPRGVAIAGDGSIYFSDAGNNAVRHIAPDAIITTIAGTGLPGYSGDGGPATSARLFNPAGLDIAPEGIYIADASNDRIRFVYPNGTIYTYLGPTNSISEAGDQLLTQPQSVAGSMFQLVVADAGHNALYHEHAYIIDAST